MNSVTFTVNAICILVLALVLGHERGKNRELRQENQQLREELNSIKTEIEFSGIPFQLTRSKEKAHARLIEIQRSEYHH